MSRSMPGYRRPRMSPLAAHTLVGGRYRAEEVLGRGGMGTVWRAVDTRLERPVAIKEVLLPLEDDQRELARSRFRREAHAAARISHPGVVAVYDVVDEGDRLCLVMEFVDAPTLTELVARRGPLDPVPVAALGLRLAEAVGAAHAQGVVHRDIKPSNVLVPDGPMEAKLADFGIASTVDGTRITLTGSVLGSPSFMAPEQASGAASTPATDLYGLGATLYFAVEGVPPHERDGAVATVAAVVHDPPRMPTNAGPLGPLLHDLLAKDPEVRPHLAEVQARLATITDSTPTVAAQPTAEQTVVLPPAPQPTKVLPSAPPTPPPARPAEPAMDSRQIRRRSVAGSRNAGPAIALVLLALLVGGVAWALSRDGGRLSTETLATTPTTAATTAPPTSIDAILAGPWVEYVDDATGFRIAYPKGWSVSTAGTRTDFTDPTGTTFLRVDWTDEPGNDPVKAWEDLAPDFAASHDGYQEIRIEETEFKDLRAAVWEFLFDDASGTRHALDLGMITGDFGFALFFQTPAEEWDALAPVFQRFQDEFIPPSDEDNETGRGNGNGRGGGEDD